MSEMSFRSTGGSLSERGSFIRLLHFLLCRLSPCSLAFTRLALRSHFYGIAMTISHCSISRASWGEIGKWVLTSNPREDGKWAKTTRNSFGPRRMNQFIGIIFPSESTRQQLRVPFRRPVSKSTASPRAPDDLWNEIQIIEIRSNEHYIFLFSRLSRFFCSCTAVRLSVSLNSMVTPNLTNCGVWDNRFAISVSIRLPKYLHFN